MEKKDLKDIARLVHKVAASLGYYPDDELVSEFATAFGTDKTALSLAVIKEN